MITLENQIDMLGCISYSAVDELIHELRTRAVKTPTPATVAFSYQRFSSPAQADGDSLRRQSALRDAWLKRHPHVRLDTSLKLIDAGVSGFTGKHRTDPKHALAAFIEKVEEGTTIPPGSYLIVENLDRLTRESPIDSIPSVMNLIRLGIRVVQLAPTEVVYDSEMDTGRLMAMLWELARGHGESKRKQGLSGETWRAKKQAARDHKTPVSKQCPAWLELAEGKWRVKADAARAVRRIYEWCAEGTGTFGILAKLNENNVKPFGRSGKWERSYIKKLLTTEAVIGTYQPGRGRTRIAEGEPIPGFYPPIIDEKLYFAARNAMKARARRSGRPPKTSGNPFSGLLTDALDGCPLHVAGSRGKKYLVSARALMKEKGTTWRAFPLDVFKKEVLSQLAELKGADLFASPEAARLTELTRQLAEIGRQRDAATERFEADPESQHWQNLVTKYDREHRAVAKELAEERYRSANPLAASWQEAVERLTDEKPERVRAGLMQVIEAIHVLIVVPGVTKLAAVQVVFRGGGSRSYIISYAPQRGSHTSGKPAESNSETFAEAGLPTDADLRDPKQAAKLEALILKHADKLASKPTTTTTTSGPSKPSTTKKARASK